MRMSRTANGVDKKMAIIYLIPSSRYRSYRLVGWLVAVALVAVTVTVVVHSEAIGAPRRGR